MSDDILECKNENIIVCFDNILKNIIQWKPGYLMVIKCDIFVIGAPIHFVTNP